MTAMQTHVEPGRWRTVYTQWGSGAKRVGVFIRPAGMKIKIRHGAGWFGFNRQKQTLDGINTKRLVAGGLSTYLRVRFQVRVKTSTHLHWTLFEEGPDL